METSLETTVDVAGLVDAEAAASPEVGPDGVGGVDASERARESEASNGDGRPDASIRGSPVERRGEGELEMDRRGK